MDTGAKRHAEDDYTIVSELEDTDYADNKTTIEVDDRVCGEGEDRKIKSPSPSLTENNDPCLLEQRPDSLRLESVLEYTNKIKAFLGLEEESLYPDENVDRIESNFHTPNEDDPIAAKVLKEQDQVPIATDFSLESNQNVLRKVPDDSNETQKQCHLGNVQLPDILESNPNLSEAVSDISPDIIPNNNNSFLGESKENLGLSLDFRKPNSNLIGKCSDDTLFNDSISSDEKLRDSDARETQNASTHPETNGLANVELDEKKKNGPSVESDPLTYLTEHESRKVKDEKESDLAKLEGRNEHGVNEKVDFLSVSDSHDSASHVMKEKTQTECETRDVTSNDNGMKTNESDSNRNDLITIKNDEIFDDSIHEKPYQILDIVEGLLHIDKKSDIAKNKNKDDRFEESLQTENKETVSVLPDFNERHNNENEKNIEDIRRLSTEVVTAVLQSAGDQIKMILDEQNCSRTGSVGFIPALKEDTFLQCTQGLQEASKDTQDSKLLAISIDSKESTCLPPEMIPDFPTLNIQNSFKDENGPASNSAADTKQKKIEMKGLSASVESIVICTVDGSFEIDPDTQCGFGAFRPLCIQQFATAKIYLVLYSILGILHGSYYTYLVGVLSTLEKRFEFKSKTSGSIMMLDELTPLFLGVLVGHFGGRAHRPRMLSFGMFLSAFCCFASALPYFLYGPATHLSSTSVHNVTGPEMCDGKSRLDYCDSDDRPPTMTAITLLMLGSFLKGFGNLAYYAIGLAYLDDNAKKKNSPLYFAVAFALRLLGPMVGYLMSSAFLKYYESPFDDPGFGADDPRWIGGWWMGFMLQGILLLIFAGPIALFPRRLPGHISVTQEKEQIAKPFFEGLGEALRRLIRNPLFVLITLNAILTIYGNFGYYIMVPKYMENQFHFSASTASLFAGPPGIAAVMLSTILGGYLIWKFKPSAKFLSVGLVAVEIVSTVGYLLLMIPQCEKTELANFGLGEESLVLEDTCNINCNCSTVSFNPICGPDGKTTYFSPCYAGCSYQEDQSYFNCSCTGDYPGNATATKGFCSVNCWSEALIYIIMLPIFQFTCNTVRVAFTIILLRSMKPEDKNIALGVFETCVSTFAFIPFPILYGALVDSTCLVWEQSCEESGNCWFYDMEKFNYSLHGASAAFCGLAVVCLSAIFFFIDRIQDLYEDFDEGTLQSNSEEKKMDSVIRI